MSAGGQRRVAGIALLASILWIALPLAGLGHPGFNDDSACGTDPLRTGGIARFQAAGSVNPLQHCPICHLQRASSGATRALPIETGVVAQPAGLALFESQHLIAFLTADRPPARAPPTPELL